jgi:hypothetical protein
MYTYIRIYIHTHTHSHTHTPYRTTRDAQSAAEAVVRASRTAWEENAKVRKKRRGWGGGGGGQHLHGKPVWERDRENGGGEGGRERWEEGREREIISPSLARAHTPSLPPLLPPLLARTRSSHSASLSLSALSAHVQGRMDDMR